MAQLEEERMLQGMLETRLVCSLELIEKKDKEILEAATMVKLTHEL